MRVRCCRIILGRHGGGIGLSGTVLWGIEVLLAVGVLLLLAAGPVWVMSLAVAWGGCLDEVWWLRRRALRRRFCIFRGMGGALELLYFCILGLL